MFKSFTFSFTGTKTTALNLGSYNYLGFSENKGSCAEASINALRKYGCGTAGARHDIGKCGQIYVRFL